MKTFILLLLFAFFGLNMLTAQNYSEVYNSVYDRYDLVDTNGTLVGYKIWNDIYDRWDFKDSNGNLIGYREYNSVYNRWDYTDLRTQNNQPKQTGRYNVHDYGEVKSNFNTDLAVQALQARKSAYDRNKYLIQQEVDKLGKYLNEYNTEFRRRKAEEIYTRRINSFFEANKNADFSSTSIFNQAINKVRSIHEETILEVNEYVDLSSAGYFYNIGLEDSKNGFYKNAKLNFEKTLSIDPNHFNCLINLSILLIDRVNKINGQQKSLGISYDDNKKYTELEEERIKILEEVLPLLKRAYKIDPNYNNLLQIINNIEKQQ